MHEKNDSGTSAGKPVRVLVLVDELWGANINIDEGKPNILAQLLSFGWELTLVSPLPDPKPCPVAAPYPKPAAFEAIVPARSIADAGAYDGLLVLPGRTHVNLLRDPDCLRLVREARTAKLAAAAFCRGVRVFAAAGILDGATVTGHPDFEKEYLAAGARYIGYKDLKSKSDAPPPVVDGIIVTALRSNYYRAETCEAVRIAVENSRRVRGFAGQGSGGMARNNKAGKASEPAFAIYADSEELKSALLCVLSIRAFGERAAKAPVAVLTEGGADSVPSTLLASFERQGCSVLDFSLPESLRNYTYCAKAAAAARAEAWAKDSGADELVWMDADTLILREPSEIMLNPEFIAGGRPVHHLLIGSEAGAPLDAFWRSVLDATGIDEALLFPLRTTIDRVDARFYPNAGFLAVRPEAGILSAWKDSLLRFVDDEAVQAAVTTAPHRIFFHQAVLACVLAKTAGPSGFMEFSFGYNFPLHLAERCPATLKPGKLDDLYTLRYDAWNNLPGDDSAWNGIAIPPRVKEWLGSALANIG